MGTVVELPIIAPEVVPYIMPVELGLPIMLPGVVVSDSGHPTAANASSTTSAMSTSVVLRLLPFIGPPFTRPHRLSASDKTYRDDRTRALNAPKPRGPAPLLWSHTTYSMLTIPPVVSWLMLVLRRSCGQRRAPEAHQLDLNHSSEWANVQMPWSLSAPGYLNPHV